ncbi:hypothetical protein [Oryza sativa Japonica Group]|uniref:Uncharacterized protein n=1 Tax=Oryza sativa subsp. japonica TaxID=39947 RepID=Q9ASN7_ORYSJ|nr:hypothetical protein [Oryza sativa Japonica Group]
MRPGSRSTLQLSLPLLAPPFVPDSGDCALWTPDPPPCPAPAAAARLLRCPCNPNRARPSYSSGGRGPEFS